MMLLMDQTSEGEEEEKRCEIGSDKYLREEVYPRLAQSGPPAD
jgi:hypothetical protein